jgi:hypothetical protein
MKSGMQIPRATLNVILGHMEEAKHIERFSFRKESSSTLVLTVSPKPGSDPRFAKRIHRKLASVLGALAELSVRIADSPKSDSIAD